MAESDAEWYTPVGRRRPRPRPATDKPLLPTPWVPRYPLPGRNPKGPRRPTVRPPHKRHPHDEADTAASRPTNLSAGAVASISIVSSLVVVAGILILLYFTFLRKKFTKKNNASLKNDFCMRVEDVNHILIDDSSNTYVNTKDIQKWVRSIKQKATEPFARISNPFPTDADSAGTHTSKPSAANNFGGRNSPKITPSAPKMALPSRPAPHPPKKEPPFNNATNKSPASLLEHATTTVPVPALAKIGLKEEKNTCQAPLPPILPKPKFASKHECVPDCLEPKYKSTSPEVPTKPLPFSVNRLKVNKKPILPPLKTNLVFPIHKLINSVDTPETSETIVSADEEARPELLSLSQKKALWESAKSKP